MSDCGACGSCRRQSSVHRCADHVGSGRIGGLAAFHWTVCRYAATAAVHDEIQKYVDKANATVSRAESVRKFVVLDTQFTQENKCLTPSLKVVRPAVNRVFAQVIDQQLYSGKR